MKTGMPILYENPREVGADRIVNAVAAYERWPQGAIVVDFGTATTFDVVTARGEYAGGVIAPGLTVSADALYSGDREAAARRDRRARAPPSAATPSPACRRGWSSATPASSTPSSSASGPRSTSRRASSAPAASPPLIAREARTIDECDDMLTLQGLALLYERNRSDAR